MSLKEKHFEWDEVIKVKEPEGRIEKVLDYIRDQLPQDYGAPYGDDLPKTLLDLWRPDDLPSPLEIKMKEKIRKQEEMVGRLVDSGNRPVVSFTSAGTPWISWFPRRLSRPKIMIMETYALTSFYGDYGVGKTIKTFSLLPNEKTRISVKTWKTSETTSRQASSILDSWTKDSSDSFENGVQNENTSSEQFKESGDWYIDAEVKASGGMGFWSAEASVKGGAKGSTNQARENLAKNVSNATKKQVANASSKRNVEVNTSSESKVTAGEEETIVRELENINAGRVLNFVFRQLNQEYITYLHLIDVRLAFSDGLGGNSESSQEHYKEFTLGQIDEFLEYCIRDKRGGETVNPKEKVRQMIVEELTSIYDYKGKKHEFIEAVDIEEPDTERPVSIDVYLDPKRRVNKEGKRKLYLRVKRNPFYSIDPRQPNYEKHSVEGIILSKETHVLPTDSIIVEALLGQSEALDKYSIDSRRAAIDMKRAEIDRMRLAESIVEKEDKEKAAIFAKIYPEISDRKENADGLTTSPSNPVPIE